MATSDIIDFIKRQCPSSRNTDLFTILNTTPTPCDMMTWFQNNVLYGTPPSV